jgi:GAF domain-containing protein
VIPDERSALALVGTVAALIGESGEAESTLAAVTDALRTGLGADRVRLWVRAT